MKQLNASIEIDAPAPQVWELIDDLDSYREWNPFIVSASGEKRVGGRLDVVIQAPGMKPVRFRPHVLGYEPGRLIVWKGVFLIPGLFDGRHALRVDPLDGGRARFTTHEDVTGILVPLLGKIMKASQDGFELMVRAVKARSETAG